MSVYRACVLARTSDDSLVIYEAYGASMEEARRGLQTRFSGANIYVELTPYEEIPYVEYRWADAKERLGRPPLPESDR